nr:hypothetical protein [Tanacetum cinerariifolium]
MWAEHHISRKPNGPHGFLWAVSGLGRYLETGLGKRESDYDAATLRLPFHYTLILMTSNQEMKQQIVIFEEDKRMFLAKNDFLEKVSSSVQKEYNDLLASNDVLKQRLKTKFKFSKHDTSLEKMIEMIEKEYESNVSKIFITSSTFETKNLELVKKMGDKVKCFDEEKKVFEIKISKLEKLASQNYTSLQKENYDLRTSYNVLKEEYETFCEKLKKENDDLKMHYKRLFDSIKQKNVVSPVFYKINSKSECFRKDLHG